MSGGGNSLRIIGGRWRSRRIRFVDAEGLRPTPDRVRETLFNWLQFEIAGATCLDAFAGSGALGFEALSRGAARVVMIERHAPQRQALQAAATALAAEGATVLGGDALALVATPGEWCPPAGFDGVFLDPPYQAGLLPGMVARLLAPGWLKPGAFVYVEADVDWPALGLPTSLVLEKQTRAGAVHAMLVRYRPA